MTTIADGLEKLKQLRDAGDLTPQAYAAAKAMLLSPPPDSRLRGDPRAWGWAGWVAWRGRARRRPPWPFSGRAPRLRRWA